MSLTWSERVIEAAALFLLVFTPLAFGTTEPWSEAVAELVVLGMVIVYVVSTVRNWEIRVELPPGWLPAALFLGLATLQLIAGDEDEAPLYEEGLSVETAEALRHAAIEMFVIERCRRPAHAADDAELAQLTSLFPRHLEASSSANVARAASG